MPRLRGSDGGVARSSVEGVRDRCKVVEEADTESSVRARCSCYEEDAATEVALFLSLHGGKVVAKAERQRWWCG